MLRLCLRLSVPGRSSVGSSNLMMGRPMAHIHHPQSPLSQLGERASERASGQAYYYCRGRYTICVRMACLKGRAAPTVNANFGEADPDGQVAIYTSAVPRSSICVVYVCVSYATASSKS